MSFSDVFTGGAGDKAQQYLADAQMKLGQVNVPSAAQLTLPELQQYVNAGLMTPAQMEAYLQKDNAYNTENTPQTGTAAQIAALNQLSIFSGRCGLQLFALRWVERAHLYSFRGSPSRSHQPACYLVF